jgi:hypothetical protein
MPGSVESVSKPHDPVGGSFSMEVRRWCAEQLGGVKHAESLREEMSEVFLVQLDDGRSVVVKIRDDPDARAEGCLEVQHRVAAAGLPCPKPLTRLARIGRLSVHAEEWVPGGDRLLGDHHEVAELSAHLLADVMTALAGYRPPHLPLPNPYWLRWDYSGPTDWPPHVWIDAAPNQDPLPTFIADAARRVRRRMRRSTLPNVVGHGDWETQNLRWLRGRPHVIHDWDSAAYLPEAAIIGAAAGAFASNETPTLANIESSEAFLQAYQARRRQRFTREELQIAWAASLWPAIHNSRAEFRFNLEPVAGKALAQQTQARLAHASA